MEVLLIDNSPISERDKPVFLKYQELCREHPDWIPPHLWHPWYDEYLKTDHWMNIREIISEYWNYKCSQCNEWREPKEVHHRDKKYECLWKEKSNDVVYNCETCHQIVHSRWPDRENNNELRRFVSSAIMNISNSGSKKRLEEIDNLKAYGRLNEIFNKVASDCQSQDKDLRDSAFWLIGRWTLASLDFQYHHSEIMKYQIKNYLIESLYSEMTGEDMPNKMDFIGIHNPEKNKMEVLHRISDDAIFLLGKLADLDIYKTINIASCWSPE